MGNKGLGVTFPGFDEAMSMPLLLPSVARSSSVGDRSGMSCVDVLSFSLVEPDIHIVRLDVVGYKAMKGGDESGLLLPLMVGDPD